MIYKKCNSKIILDKFNKFNILNNKTNIILNKSMINNYKPLWVNSITLTFNPNSVKIQSKITNKTTNNNPNSNNNVHNSKD